MPCPPAGRSGRWVRSTPVSEAARGGGVHHRVPANGSGDERGPAADAAGPRPPLAQDGVLASGGVASALRADLTDEYRTAAQRGTLAAQLPHLAEQHPSGGRIRLGGHRAL